VLNRSLIKKGFLLIASILLLLGFGFNFLSVNRLAPTVKPELIAKKVTQPEVTVISNVPQLPEAITPEGVGALSNGNTPYLLINADDSNFQHLTSPGPIRLIYYSTTPSFRSAQKLVRQDRQSKLTGMSDSTKLESQRLTGTPLEWQRLGLTFFKSPLPTKPQPITPRQLSEAIKDNVDLQIIDFRPTMPGVTEATPFPQALRWMPHEALNNLPKLSKEKWMVLIGIGSEDVQPIAFEYFQKGYVLTTVLDGGYPAWVNATDR